MILTIDEFISKREGDQGPLWDWKWHCTSLPFGFRTDYVETVSLPFPSFNVKPLFGGGTFTYYPGFEEISAFDMQLYEDQKVRAIEWLTMWKGRIRDPDTGAYFLPTNYKYDIGIELLNDKNQSVVKATLKNCWPTQKGNWDLTNSSTNGILKVHQNFSCDGIKFST